MTHEVLAETWDQRISLPVEVDYDTNPTMVVNNPKAIWREIATPSYSLTGVQNLDTISADISVHIERNSDQSILLNRNDPTLNLGWHREMDRGLFGIKLHYDESSYLASQLTEVGTVGTDSTRRTASVTGDWQRYVSERLSLSLNGSLSSLAFGGGSSTSVSPDSRNYTASAMLNYMWVERLEPFVQFSVNRYVPENGIPSTDLYSASIGTKLSVSDYVDLTISGGMNETSGATQGSGWQGAFDMTRKTEYANMALGLSRSITPYSNGGFIESDQLKASVNYSISEINNAGLDFSWRKNNDLTGSELRQADAWYGRTLSPDWNVRITCRHRETSSAGQEARGDMIGISVVYLPPSKF